jgi:hypothetical protein
MKVYYPPRKTRNVSVTHVTIFCEVDFKEEFSFVMYLPEEFYMFGQNT